MFIGGALCDEKMKVKRSYLKVGFPVRSARTGTKDSNGPVACTTYSHKLLIPVLHLEEREMSFQIHNSVCFCTGSALHIPLGHSSYPHLKTENP